MEAAGCAELKAGAKLSAGNEALKAGAEIEGSIRGRRLEQIWTKA